MQWWFEASDHQVKIVLLVKLDSGHQEITIEKFVEEPAQARTGATLTRWASALQPVCRQRITINRDRSTSPPTYHTVRGALVLEFRLLFLRDPTPQEGGDFIIGVRDLERFAERVWGRI
jgi:hypothetical protein